MPDVDDDVGIDEHHSIVAAQQRHELVRVPFDLRGSASSVETVLLRTLSACAGLEQHDFVVLDGKLDLAAGLELQSVANVLGNRHLAFDRDRSSHAALVGITTGDDGNTGRSWEQG